MLQEVQQVPQIRPADDRGFVAINGNLMIAVTDGLTHEQRMTLGQQLRNHIIYLIKQNLKAAEQGDADAADAIEGAVSALTNPAPEPEAEERPVRKQNKAKAPIGTLHREDAIACAGVYPWTFDRYCAQMHISPVKVGRWSYIRISDLNTILNNLPKRGRPKKEYKK